jgi:hypothetical protein
VWHASIAVQGFLGPVHYVLWDERTRDVAKRTVLELIADVGTGEIRRDRSDLVLHARRRLSDAEIARQTPEWCAIKAVDLAGGGIPW